MTTEIASFLTSNGIGQSIAVGVGGDPIIGSDFVQLIELLEADPTTSAVVIYGEPGGVAEEELARHLERNGSRLRINAFLSGRFVDRFEGMRFGTRRRHRGGGPRICARQGGGAAPRGGFRGRRVRRSFDRTSHMSDFWRTSISRVKPNEILVRGYPIEQLTRRCRFGDTVYLLLKGELPSGAEGRMVEAILVSCCEHSLGFSQRRRRSLRGLMRRPPADCRGRRDQRHRRCPRRCNGTLRTHSAGSRGRGPLRLRCGGGTARRRTPPARIRTSCPQSGPARGHPLRAGGRVEG